MTIIRRVDPMTGKTNSMDLPISYDRYVEWYTGDELIQNALPELDADQREFLITGMVPDTWNNALWRKEQTEEQTDE